MVVENGLGSFATEWSKVQAGVERFTRICTYDRAGYAPSDPGPGPRTFAQINLELHEALRRAGERGPFVMVAHSFGGGVVRSFVERYPDDVAGLVLVDVVSERQYIRMGKHAGRIADDAKGRAIPEPRLDGTPVVGLEETEASQREWSSEYFARWLKTPGDGVLGEKPLVVLARAQGGYPNDLDKPAEELERARIEGHEAMARLSKRGRVEFIDAGHNLHVEASDRVVAAIREVVTAAR